MTMIRPPKGENVFMFFGDIGSDVLFLAAAILFALKYYTTRVSMVFDQRKKKKKKKKKQARLN